MYMVDPALFGIFTNTVQSADVWVVECIVAFLHMLSII